jgi:transcriptional regulator with XRE-family HTH domain|nr:MAG TPA: helix-turn-helix domain protein [Caudoviricetes sp.]
MPFKDMLKYLREQKGLSQEKLAELTQLSKSAISMYENGNREPKFETLETLADFFNVDMNTLLDKNPDTTLSPRDERQIAADLEKMLADLDNQNAMAAMGGTVEDDEDRELLRASLLATMRLAKKIAKEKYTPKKYRQNKD